MLVYAVVVKEVLMCVELTSANRALFSVVN
jgi:hypothetical protein